jgi:DNA end-binding protein Ku
MARALWKGTLGFGLVSIPVELVTAVRDLGPHFHFLRKSDKSRIGFQKVSKKDGKVVSADELVKGFEYDKGRYVVLTKQDFDEAAVKRNSRIELLDFVDAGEVDDRYFNKPYYLLPSKGGEASYALLRDALRQAGRVGIAKFVMRDQPHLAALEVIKDALVLSTMRFREELVPVSEYNFPKVKARDAEMRMARQLIDAYAAEWDPDKYTDEYRANLMAIIEARRKRQKPELERQEPETSAEVVDLMERLRQSLEKGKGRGGRKTAAKSSSTKRKTARKRAA